MPARPIVVIYANARARRSHVNRPLAEALAALPDVEVRDLHARYPDYDIDVVAEQRALSCADTVVLQFPTFWFSVPPLLKLWMDEVLERGWAHGPGGTALRGKSCLVVASTRGTEEDYSPEGVHRHLLASFLLPLEQMALECGMTWRPPIVIHDAYRLDESGVQRMIAEVMGALGHGGAGDSANAANAANSASTAARLELA